MHEDGEGILDRYRYEYDLMGNKTAIIKERRGLELESGSYHYGYDALGRLTSVMKDGHRVRDYQYDAFSNRKGMEDYTKGRKHAFTYDARNRLMVMEETDIENEILGTSIKTDYEYDNRGNLIKEERDGKLIHGYAYGAMNRIAESWNDSGDEATYIYNGLGQRVERNVNGERENYLLDLMKPYHNLLEINGRKKRQVFFSYGNVTTMEEEGKKHYYLQDELGSPMRVSRYEIEEIAQIKKGVYFTYGYDEFGNDLGREMEGSGVFNPYDVQEVGQPFGYTGYRYDDISGTYFAQAWEYKSISGRFIAEDVIKGWADVLLTQNVYNYCFHNPIALTDYDGYYPIYTMIGECIGNTIENLGETVGNTIGEIGTIVGDTANQMCGVMGNTVQDICGSAGNMIQEIGTIMGNPYTAQLAGTLTTNAGEYAGNSIRTSGKEAKALLNMTGEYVENNIKSTTSTYGILAKTVIRDENVRGTATYGLNISGTLGVFAIDGSIGISADFKGNVAIQATGAWGVTASSNPSGSLAVFKTITNAPDIFELEESGGNAGGSVGFPISWFPAYVGADIVTAGDLDNKPYENYWGCSSAVGVGAPGVEAHAGMSYTLPSINVVNIFDILFGNKGDCVE